MENERMSINDQELEKVTGGRYLGPTFVYEIQEGDTLQRLAQRFGTTVRVLRDINGLRDTRRLRVGTRVLIPHR